MSDYEIFGWIGRTLDDVTDCWFGQSDVQTGFWLAMRERELLSVVIPWDEKRGLRLEPDISADVATGLNKLVGAELLTQSVIRAALIRALRKRFGHSGGVMMLRREGRHLRLTLVPFASTAPYKAKEQITWSGKLYLN